MHDTALAGRRILVVEDDYLLAESLNDLLVEAGINVVGPVGSVPDALSLVASGQAIDGALLDVNVRGQAVFPVADALMERGVPFSFCSGYDRYTLPQRFAHLSYCMNALQPAHDHQLAQPPDRAGRSLIGAGRAGRSRPVPRRAAARRAPARQAG